MSFDAKGLRAPVSLAVIALCSAIELLLDLTAWTGVASGRLRALAYDYGAFWPGLLDSWTPNYPVQPAVMFVTYGFLHIDFWHFATNMITLAFLGATLSRQVGQGAYLAIYGASQVGGGLAYALLTPGLIPMIGASGAIFGIAGAMVACEFSARARAGRRVWPAILLGIYLNLLNGLMWLTMDGHLAWQTHLGGFVTGAAVAAVILRVRAT